MDFSVKIIADLDVKDLQNKLNNIQKQNIKIPVKFDIQNQDISKIISGIQKQSSKIKIDTDVTGVKQAQTEIQGLKTSASQLSKFKFKFDTKGIDADLAKIESQINRFNQSAFTKEQTGQLNQIKASFSELKSIASSFNGKDILDESDLLSYNSALKTVQNQVKILSNELSGMVSFDDRLKLSNKIQTWLNNNTKATEEAKTELQYYINTLKNVDTDMSTGTFNNIRKGFSSTTSEMQALGKTGKSAIDDFKRAFGQIAQFAGAYGMIQNVVFEVPRQMVQAVRDINAAQIELRKVSEASDSQLSAYWEEAAASAQKYGATINEVINSTADWQRLGYNLDESKVLSDATTLMQRIGDNMTQQSSSEGLISTLQGFQLEADEVNRIVDEVNEVANTQPIDTAGIFAGLQRSASSMSAANNTLEETIALITAGNAVMQDPERVGNGLKTISMRIRGRICAQQIEMFVPLPLKTKVA